MECRHLTQHVYVASASAVRFACILTVHGWVCKNMHACMQNMHACMHAYIDTCMHALVSQLHAYVYKRGGQGAPETSDLKVMTRKHLVTAGGRADCKSGGSAFGATLACRSCLALSSCSSVVVPRLSDECPASCVPRPVPDSPPVLSLCACRAPPVASKASWTTLIRDESPTSHKRRVQSPPPLTMHGPQIDSALTLSLCPCNSASHLCA